METQVWQYYRTNYPGQVQVLGCDVLDGTTAQLESFRSTTGVTYPLLLDCYINLAPSTENFVRWYGDRDNFVVINKQGVVRYRAFQNYAYGNGYHLNEIRGCIDTLVTAGLAVGDDLPHGHALAASPNPSSGAVEIALALPQAEHSVRVSVLDLAGRQVCRVWDSPAPAGTRHLVWDSRDGAGRRVAPGVYLIVAEAGTVRLFRRIVIIQ